MYKIWLEKLIKLFFPNVQSKSKVFGLLYIYTHVVRPIYCYCQWLIFIKNFGRNSKFMPFVDHQCSLSLELKVQSWTNRISVTYNNVRLINSLCTQVQTSDFMSTSHSKCLNNFLIIMNDSLAYVCS